MRTETETRTLFQYDELTPEAQQEAREWYRTGFEFYSDTDFEYAATIADLFGLDIRQRPVKLMNGQTRYEPCVYYSGFSSQGDGACFEGVYRYKKGALKAVKAYAPQDTELHRIVKDLQDAQKPYLYKLTASTVHSGHYYHSGCMAVEVEHSDDQYRDIGDAETLITDALRAFADWIYSQLEKEYDYQTSDEAVEEAIRANEYEFTEDGEIA